jgi:hypothetical protein
MNFLQLRGAIALSCTAALLAGASTMSNAADPVPMSGPKYDQALNKMGVPGVRTCFWASAPTVVTPI